MKKEKFKYLYSFKYNNKYYIYLYSKHYPFYFLEYNNKTNNFTYPNIENYLDLYNKFYKNDSILLFKNINFNINNILSKFKLNINPLIKTTSGLLSIAIVLSMCGCSKEKNIPINSDNDTTFVTTLDEKNKNIYEYFQKYNMKVINKEYDGNDYIFVKEFINNKEKNQVTLNSFDEFRKYHNMNFIPTYDDVINAFENNKNIDDKQKEIIIKGINNMRNCKELNNIDLSVLYVNAHRMNFIYLSEEEMKKTVNKESVYAYFDTNTGTVYLPKNKPIKTFEFIHEVLGHGTLAYRDENESTLTVFDCTNYIMLPNENQYVGYSLGIMISEGGANLIAHMATNDYSIHTFYELYEEELRIISEFCHVNIGELFNYKGIDFYELMYKNNINTPVEYIFKMDGIIKGQLYCEFSELMERLFIDATEEKIISASKEKQNEIIKNTINIIKNSYFNHNDELTFKYNNGELTYNFEDSAKSYEENMNNIIKQKNK